MTPEEKAYIAGIIDGEGSIMLIKFHRNKFPAPCVTIASASYELLEWIKNKTNMGTIKSKKNYKPNKHQDSFTYMITYNNAINFLREIEPYLIITQKKLRAKLIINEYKSVTLRNGRYSPQLLKLKKEFYDKFISIK